MFKLYCLILCCLYFRFIYMNAFALESILMTLSRAKILLFFVKEIKNELFFILSIILLSICHFLSCFLLSAFYLSNPQSACGIASSWSLRYSRGSDDSPNLLRNICLYGIGWQCRRAVASCGSAERLLCIFLCLFRERAASILGS